MYAIATDPVILYSPIRKTFKRSPMNLLVFSWLTCGAMSMNVHM